MRTRITPDQFEITDQGISHKPTRCTFTPHHPGQWATCGRGSSATSWLRARVFVPMRYLGGGRRWRRRECDLRSVKNWFGPS
jgi:hypothetical protein